MTGPLVTLGIISCNRLHYLRTVVASARDCIRYPALEWVIVDNASVEDGLQQYIRGLDFVQHKIVRTERRPSTECVDALNEVITVSTGEYVMILPDDVQFIVRGDWLGDFVELVDRHPNIGTVAFDAQRRVTIHRLFASRRPAWPFRQSPRRRRYATSSGREFLGYGDSKPGIAAAGIVTFARRKIWTTLGPWKAVDRQTVADATGGGETDMLSRYALSGLALERVLAKVPVAAGIVTDARGTKARIRGNRRYGKYFAPPAGRLYYRVWDESELDRFAGIRPVVAFEDIVEPVGFELPCDTQGNLLKNPHLRDDDEFEWIHPRVAGVDIR